MKEITSGQMLEFWRQVGINQISRGYFQNFLDHKLVAKSAEKILEYVGIVSIPANPDRFIWKDHFKVDTSNKAPVKISFLGSNLKKWFSDVIEEPREATSLKQSNLLKGSVDTPILNELGGHDKVASIWYAIWYLMLTGQLARNRWYVFYIEDKIRSKEDEAIAFVNAKGQKRVLRAVRCDWGVGGFGLEACSVLFSYRWRGGDQVFSRNSAA